MAVPQGQASAGVGSATARKMTVAHPVILREVAGSTPARRPSRGGFCDCAQNDRLAYFCPSMRTQVVFSSVYLSNACSDLSRPLPLCL